MNVPDELREVYLSTEISVSVNPGDGMPLERALGFLPTPIHVITACNPLSVRQGGAVNERLMEELDSALAELDVLVFPAVGRSPDGAWSEPSFAVWGLPRIDAIELGQRFEQNAIFEVTDDEVIVLGCLDSWEVRRPIQRGDTDESTPFGLEDDGDREAPSAPSAGDEVNLKVEPNGLPGVIARTLGFTAESTLVRAGYAGWTHEGRFGSPCPTCDVDLDLFGCSAQTRSGDVVRLMAFACGGCETILWPHDAPADVRECAKAWRKLDVASIFPPDREDDESYSVYVIELEGEIDERSPQSDPQLPWVYVGQSAKSPEERFVQHLEGYKSSRWVRRFGSHLRPDLYAGAPELKTRVAALAGEAWLAASLRSRGYPVKGGH